jgi:unsaturated rhamnogalacturonyl hydrolase
MTKSTLFVCFALIALSACQAFEEWSQKDSANITDWPSEASPKKIGLLMSENILNRPFDFQVNKRRKSLIYPEVLAWRGALIVANRAEEEAILDKATKRFDFFLGQQGAGYLSTNAHGDFRVTGVLPLEIYKTMPDPKYMSLGLSFADRQWQDPSTNGFTREARYWVDDMYMINALQVSAYRVSGNRIYLDRTADLTADYLAKLQKDNGLFIHAPFAPYYWSRGNGWFAAGMAELLTVLPKDHPHYAFIRARFTMMMDALLACQSKTGLWRQLLDKPDYWEETSGTGMFVYAMVLGVKNGFLVGDQYKTAIRRGWLALAERVDDEGNVSDVCVGTNPNKVEKTYLERPRVKGDLHGQLAVIWCAGALID